MRIAVDTRMIKSSGIGKVIENILRRIILKKTDWEFILLGNIDELRQFSFTDEDNVELIKCTAPIYSIREQFELKYKIPSNIDVFWSPHYNIPLFYRGKLIVTVHDVFHLAMSNFVIGIHKKIYAEFMFRMVAKKADRIIVVSNFTAKELCKYVPCDKNKITTIYNGVDDSWFHIKSGERVHSNKYFIYVGNIKPHKNLHRLLQAFSQVKDKIPQDLILVGKKDGFLSGDERIVKEAKSLGSRVTFTGYITDNLLQQYVSQSDGLIFPSLYEGFGLPPLEAMAAGVPVAVSNIESTCEVCGDDVLMFNPYDINDISLKIIELAKGKKNSISERFSWDRAVNDMIYQLYHIV